MSEDPETNRMEKSLKEIDRRVGILVNQLHQVVKELGNIRSEASLTVSRCGVCHRPVLEHPREPDGSIVRFGACCDAKGGEGQ